MNTFRLKTQEIEIEISGEREFVESQLALWFGDDAPTERVRADFIPRAISFEDFLTLKSPQTPVEKLLAGAYYLEKYGRKESFTIADLAVLQAWESDGMEQALKSGWIETSGEEAFTLTFSGQQYVQGGF